MGKSEILEEGEDIIKSDTSKTLKFIFIMTIAYAVFVIINFFSIRGSQLERSVFSIGLFILLCFLHLRHFVKGLIAKQNIIRKIEIEENSVKVYISSFLGKNILIYTFNKDELILEKGISSETDKSINLLGISDTYTLKAKCFKSLHFYFITPYWENWASIKNYFHQYNE